jgi:GT2 family glycosyltransferase
MTPLISVVIPPCRRPDELLACVERIRAPSAAAGVGFEVIVSDDAGDADLAQGLAGRQPQVRWIAGPARGPAANRNNGAARATGEWLVFTDDDCLPQDGWLAAYVDAMNRNPGCEVFEGRTRADRARQSLDEHAPLNEDGGCLWSCNLAISRQLFERIGGFDERFPYATMEDVELQHRILAAGEAIVFVDKALVIHPYRRLGGWAQLLRYRHSMRLYLRLHPAERPKFGPLYYFRAFVWALVRDIPREGARYRWRGLNYALIRAALCLLMAAEAMLPALRDAFRRGGGR